MASELEVGKVTIKSDGSNDTPGRLNLWATDTSIVANDTIGAIHAQGTDTVTSPPEDGAKIEFNADFNWGGSTNYQASRIDFFTQDNSGTNTLLSPRLTISSTGLATFSAGVTVSGGFLSLDTPTELTIASGAVTVTRSFHDVDTEGDAATDDLDTINGGSAGDILTLKTVTGSRDVTLKDATGNLRLAGDFTLTSPNDTITLIKYSTVWIETSRSDNV